MRDHLTGAFNRGAGEKRLAEDIKRAERAGGTLSLALLDLDRLKSVNDEHGHCAGDACLARFAKVLGRNVRAGDWVARRGRRVLGGHGNAGEERTAQRVLGRLGEDLRKNPLVLPDSCEERLTVRSASPSAGGLPVEAGGDIRGLLSRADDALYRAKAEGGGTVVHLD
jgi:diguanylate cyclase (GGDEF)-like protein